MAFMNSEVAILGTTPLSAWLPDEIATTVSISKDEDGNYTSSTTFANIASAYKSNKRISCKVSDGPEILELVSYSTATIMFQRILYDGTWKTVTIASNNSITVDSGKLNG